MMTPLRASFGIASNPDGGKYGSVGATGTGVKAVDRKDCVNRFKTHNGVTDAFRFFPQTCK